MRKQLTTAAIFAALTALSASPALAGEVTGSGKKEDQNQGRSWCSFSGLNDDPTAPLDGSGPNGPGGRSQSFGQENRLGLQDPHVANPGTFCNPNRTPLPPQPNRVKAAAAARTREPVTRVEVFAAAGRVAGQSAAAAESNSASGLEDLTHGAASIDRSRTSIGNYLRYGKFRKGASFALFGTNTVNGQTHMLLCVGNVEVVRTNTGRTRVGTNLTCPVS